MVVALVVIQTAASPLWANEPSPVPFCPLPLSAGAPACAAGSSPGSAPAPRRSTRHVGNPIDVVSGNKYQREIDYQSLGSDLALVRHYNSSLIDHDLGLGPGWRHSYHVVLSRPDTESLSIVQSDGRLIEFRAVPRTSSPTVFRTDHASDGLILFDEQARWYLPDGRLFEFHGPFLISIRDARKDELALQLRYRNKRLISVSDRHGQSLKFEYVSRKNALPTYGSDQTHKPLGALDSVELPNGQRIQYTYGSRRELIKTQYPEGAETRFGYDDAIWPTHLSERESTGEDRLSRWGYDEHGRGIAWSEFGRTDTNPRAGLRIERRSQPAGSTRDGQKGDAMVTYEDGQRRRYQWSYDVQQGSSTASASDLHSHSSLSIDCTGCAPTPVAEAKTTTISMRRNVGRQRQGIEMWPSEPGSVHDWKVLLHRGDDSVELAVNVDRLGEVTDMALGPHRLGELASRWLNGDLQVCSSTAVTTAKAVEPFDRLRSLAEGGNACRDDVPHLLDLKHVLETTVPQEPELQFRFLPPTTHGPDPFCSLPDGRSCGELRSAREFAGLSACVYETVPCPNEFARVDPASVGLRDKHFDNAGFNALLFQDTRTGDYVLAFRGTDGDGDDWDSNIKQGRGEFARQYDLAVHLADRLKEKLPGAHFHVTGHSLGGGLATTAALRLGVKATVFNPAAVHPKTAERYEFEKRYANAEKHVDVYTTESDALTGVQGVGDHLPFLGAEVAPGRHTEIPDPPHEWFSQQRGPGSILNGPGSVLAHGIDAVTDSMDRLLAKNCSTTSP